MKAFGNLRSVAGKSLPLLIIAVSLIMLQSCYKERMGWENIHGEYQPDVAAPLVHSNLTMRDILNDYDHNDLFVEDGSHFLYLIYNNRVFSQRAEDFIYIPNQYLNTNYSFSVTGSLPYGTDAVAPPYSFNTSFTTPNGERLDELFVKSGLMRFVISSSDMNQNATIRISIPSATLSGIPFQKDINYSFGMTTTASLDLTGYKIVFDNSGSNVNSLAITYQVTVHGTGNPNNSPYNFSMGESFENLKYSKLIGDFKQHAFILNNDTVEVRINNNNFSGHIDFENPKAHFYIQNSFGMPIALNLSSFRSKSYVNPPYDVNITGITNPIVISYPNFSQIGDSALTQIHLDKTNSNINDAINTAPKLFIVDVAGLSNPAGGTNTNFVTDKSAFNVNMEIELPLYGKSWDFIVQDTLNVNFGIDLDNVKKIYFRINTQNAFPAEARMQVYFIDPDNIIIDSLMTPLQQVVAAAPVGPGPDYRTTTSVHKLTETMFEGERVKRLANVEKVIVKGYLNTTNCYSSGSTQLVKFYSDYGLDTHISFRAILNVEYNTNNQ
jgi:hypothetical protein